MIELAPEMERLKMAVKDLDYFMSDAEAFAALSDEEKATLFAGQSLEGETDAAQQPTEEISEAPAAEPEQAQEDAKDEKAESAEPVVLARDGKHTIPFSELESARENSRHWEQIAKQQAELIEQIKTAKGQPEQSQPDATTESQGFDFATKEMEYMDAAAMGDTEKAVAIRAEINDAIRKEAVAQASAQIAQANAQQEANTLIARAADQAVQKYPFLNENEAAMRETVEWRDFLISKGVPAHEAIIQAAERIAPSYQPAGKPTASAAPAVDVKAKAAEVVAATKPKAPTSLSEVPAGTSAPHDEAAAIREMQGFNLMNKFAGKTPDQIMELMSRII